MDDNSENDYEILTDEYMTMDLNFKIIIIGDAGVGKSSLTNKAIKNIFDVTYSPTIGLEYSTMNIRIKDKKIKLQIWDTCGQEKFRSMITSFYRNTSLAILTYAINEKQSFYNIENWLNELKTYSNPEIKIFLVGTKSDLEKSREVQREDAENIYKEHQLDYFIETSAYTGFNVQNVFIQAAKELYKVHLRYKDKGSRIGSFTESVDEQNYHNILLDDENKGIQKKGCCG